MKAESTASAEAGRLPWYATARGAADIILGLISMLLAVIWIVKMPDVPCVDHKDAAEVLMLRAPYFYFLALSIVLFTIGTICINRYTAFTRCNVWIGLLMIIEGLFFLPVSMIAFELGPKLPGGIDGMGRDFLLIVFGRCPFILIGISILIFSIPARRWAKRLGKRMSPGSQEQDTRYRIKEIQSTRELEKTR